MIDNILTKLKELYHLLDMINSNKIDDTDKEDIHNKIEYLLSILHDLNI